MALFDILCIIIDICIHQSSSAVCISGAHHGHTIIIPIQYAHLLLTKQDRAIILQANQHMNLHLSGGVPYQLAGMYQLAVFKPPTRLFNVILWGCVGTVQNDVIG